MTFVPENFFAPTALLRRVSCRLKHSIDQRPQAPIEFRLPERFSQDWRIPVRLPQASIPSRDEGEWDAPGIEPLGNGVYCFAMFQLDVKQRRIAFGRFDQGERVRIPNCRPQYETSMSSDRILEFQSDNAVIFDHKNRENLLA
jgi:hypothetical protein